jgi:hypothetical protein
MVIRSSSREDCYFSVPTHTVILLGFLLYMLAELYCPRAELGIISFYGFFPYCFSYKGQIYHRIVSYEWNTVLFPVFFRSRRSVIDFYPAVST